MKDVVEESYEREIEQACREGDNDKAHELSVRLSEYQKYYKVN